MTPSRDTLGAVAIGRNEGERLRRCLASLAGHVKAVVYVDSGSTDGSVELARSLGVDVVELDMSRPFTAARARNEGYARLKAFLPNREFVQFVDGDCEVVAGWFDAALAVLAQRPDVAVVCGRRRERYPQQSVYNLLCDIEWDTPVGEAAACGGDALIRAAAFDEIGGYDPSLIAGEDPEMCFRFRRKGWKILRIDAEMTLHDAAMTRFSQWWKRNVRAGHAYAENAWRHGRETTERWCVRETRSNFIYGLLLPAGTLASALMTPWILLIFGAYPVLAWRIRRHIRLRGYPPRTAWIYGTFVTLGKFPQAVGGLKFHWDRYRGRRHVLIEYK